MSDQPIETRNELLAAQVFIASEDDIAPESVPEMLAARSPKH